MVHLRGGRRGRVVALRLRDMILFLLVAVVSTGAFAAGTATTQSAPAYRVGVGDVLAVFNYVDGTREEVIVRPDGMITLPLVGDVSAAGQTPSGLAKTVAEALSPFQEKTTITVSVQEIHSYKVYLLGNVGQQQQIESNAPLRLLQALSIAGGLNEFANRKILVLRDQDGQQKRIQLDYDKIIKGKAPEQNVWLQSGDMVVAL